MEDGNESVRIASEWPSLRQNVRMTPEQRNRIRKGRSPYNRDRVVEEYDYSTGPFV